MKSKTGTKQIKETRFENARLSALGIEPMSLSTLRAKAAPQQLTQPERIEFYMLMLVTSGQGVHTVDFVDCPLVADTLIFVRPGQVQQWHLDHQIEAQLILIAPAALPYRGRSALQREIDLLALDEWSTCSVLAEKNAAEVNDDWLRLNRDFNRFDSNDLDVSLIRHELLTLLLRLAKIQRDQFANSLVQRGARATYRSFLRELEKNFQMQRSVQHYADHLGCAESTLSRACLNGEGRAAKEVIDRRIVLEAQRMLAHSTVSVGDIALHLGFSEQTNFVKFFRRVIGETPSAFRLKIAAR